MRITIIAPSGAKSERHPGIQALSVGGSTKDHELVLLRKPRSSGQDPIRIEEWQWVKLEIEREL